LFPASEIKQGKSNDLAAAEEIVVRGYLAWLLVCPFTTLRLHQPTPTTCCILRFKFTPSVVLFPLHSTVFLVLFCGYRPAAAYHDAGHLGAKR
jgi:hypothetical protein